MNVLNIGSVNIDYVYQMDHFILPGETNSCRSLAIGCGGKGLNQSVALAKAGLTTYHAGIYGSEGGFLVEKLNQAGVDTSLMELGEGSNGHAIIQVDSSGQNCIILYGGTNRQFTERYIRSVLSRFRPGDILVLQNEINNLPYIMRQAHGAGLRIAFNAAPYGDEIRGYPLECLEWLIINEVEGAGLSGETDSEAIARALMKTYPGLKIMLTLGKAGCIYASGQQIVHCPAFTVTAVDTTAAGDTFIGYFLRGEAEELPILQTLRMASAASAIAVTRPGAADSVPTYAEVAASPFLTESSA